jgi:hypothetical protein
MTEWPEEQNPIQQDCPPDYWRGQTENGLFKEDTSSSSVPKLKCWYRYGDIFAIWPDGSTGLTLSQVTWTPDIPITNSPQKLTDNYVFGCPCQHIPGESHLQKIHSQRNTCITHWLIREPSSSPYENKYDLQNSNLLTKCNISKHWESRYSFYDVNTLPIGVTWLRILWTWHQSHTSNLSVVNFFITIPLDFGCNSVQSKL